MTNGPHWPHYDGALQLSQHWRWHPRGADKCHPLWSSFLCPLCIHARCRVPDKRTALCSSARNTRPDGEARTVTHPSLISVLQFIVSKFWFYHSINQTPSLSLCFFILLMLIWSSLNCHVHIPLPCFCWAQKSSKSLCVIPRISKHIWKCVKIIWGQPCNMILNFNIHFNLLKTQTHKLMPKFPNKRKVDCEIRLWHSLYEFKSG